jgi:hypothetical protein
MFAPGTAFTEIRRLQQGSLRSLFDHVEHQYLKEGHGRMP